MTARRDLEQSALRLEDGDVERYAEWIAKRLEDEPVARRTREGVKMQALFAKKLQFVREREAKQKKQSKAPTVGFGQ